MKYLVFLLLSISYFSQTITYKPNAKVFHKDLGDSIQVYYENNESFPLTFKYTQTGSNIITTLTNETFIVALPKENKLFNTVHPKDPYIEWSFNYDTKVTTGDLLNQKNLDYVYSLPFESNKSVFIMQGPFSGKTHKELNAYDFGLKLGEKVHSARKGKVIFVKDNSNENCFNESCKEKANSIAIIHDDGTMAMYGHLKFRGSLVKINQEIGEGELIGYSGNTGYSSGAHLHFEVFLQDITNGKKITINPKFKTKNNPSGEYIKPGKYYIKP